MSGEEARIRRLVLLLPICVDKAEPKGQYC